MANFKYYENDYELASLSCLKTVAGNTSADMTFIEKRMM